MEDVFYATFEETSVDFEYFVRLVRGTGCKFCPMPGDKNTGEPLKPIEKGLLNHTRVLMR